MTDYNNLQHFPIAEQLVDILCSKTGTEDKLFFRVIVSYYLSVVSAMMRANIVTEDRGTLPINMYAINLAPSGFGKSMSANLIEEKVLAGFRHNFMQSTLPQIAEQNLRELSTQKALKNGTDEGDELATLVKQYTDLGKYAFNFDSGTAPAVKQMRQMLLLSNIGSLNFQQDEMASNFLSNMEVLEVFLQLYDVGLVKQKLIKNTAENRRMEDIYGATPANMLLFGTPSKLLSGSNIEREFMDLLETGFARRCFFGFTTETIKEVKYTPDEIFERLTNSDTNENLNNITSHMTTLSDVENYNKNIVVPKEISLLFIEYQQHCEQRANALPAHSNIARAELMHRYMKSLKLAGTYAYISKADELTEEHAYGALALTEESGEAFTRLLNRDSPYIRLAKYLADIGRPVTQAEIFNDLTFYKGTESHRKELLNLAIAYGHTHNISISKTYNEDVLFIEGKTIEETNIDKLKISYSNQITSGYINEIVSFEKLPELFKQNSMHWVNHHLLSDQSNPELGGYRNDQHCIKGFNLVALDIDKDVSINEVKLLLQDYKYIIYTTKRHTEAKPRFRVVLPISHTLKLDKNDYKQFMRNLFEWLPFNVDDQTIDRPRKWLTHNGETIINKEGKLLDATLLIPNTTKSDKIKKIHLDHESLTHMERWFITNSENGNRSNQIIKYAYLLVDNGCDIETIKNKVLTMNHKLPQPLPEAELLSTVMVSAAKAIQERTR